MSIVNAKQAFGLFVLLIAVATFGYAGGVKRAGTNAAPELLMPVGARDIAMGGASIATTSGIDAIYWNPAGLARSPFGATAMFSHMTYIADIPVNYVAVGASFAGFGTLGFSLKSLGIGDIPVTNEDYPDGTGELITPTYVTLGLTYSRQLAENLPICVTTNLISERIDRVSATGFGFNAGVQYSGLGNVPGLNIGVAVKNVGPQMKFDGSALLQPGTVADSRQGFYKVDAASFDLPSTIEIGASYTTKFSEDNGLTFVSLFENNNFSADEYKVGAEYAFRDNFFLRAGWDLVSSQSDESLTSIAGVDKSTYLFGGTAGAGVHSAVGDLDVTVDYAYRAVKFLTGNHAITLKLGF